MKDPGTGTGDEPGHDGRWAASGPWIGAVLVVAAVLALIGYYRPASRAPAVAATGDVEGVQVAVGPSGCGDGWKGGSAGPVTLALRNRAASAQDIYLLGDDGRIYLEAENLGPNATRSAAATLAAGDYHLVCASTEQGAVAGPTVHLAGDYDGALTPGVLPVTDADLIRPVVTYQNWVAARLPVLHQQVRRLVADLRASNVEAAKRVWLSAHRSYETLGAAYDAFGDDNDAIDALPRTGVAPLKDKRLEGFHKIEALLWHGRTAEALGYARKLGRAIARLRRDFGTQLVMAPIDIGLRGHEILENALQLEATGAGDAGSHTSLATIDANITGTRHALAPLRSLLADRDPDLQDTDAWLDRLQQLVRSFRRGATWTPLQDLTRTQRELLDADLSQCVELLSEVAVITDPVKQMP